MSACMDRPGLIPRCLLLVGEMGEKKSGARPRLRRAIGNQLGEGLNRFGTDLPGGLVATVIDRWTTNARKADGSAKHSRPRAAARRARGISADRHARHRTGVGWRDFNSSNMSNRS